MKHCLTNAITQAYKAMHNTQYNKQMIDSNKFIS